MDKQGNIFDSKEMGNVNSSFSPIYQNIKFFHPNKIEDFEEMIKKLNPNKFLKDMLQLGELDEITNNYSFDCCSLCHNSIAWALKQLKNTIYFYEIKVCYGKYIWAEHSWLQLGDYYIDLTLAQFRKEAPRIAITLVSDASRNGYKSSSIQTAENWIRDELGSIIK